jgi:hypothetical protein
MLIKQIQNIFNKYGETLVKAYKQKLNDDGTNVSGQAIRSLGFTVTANSLNIFGNSYILRIDTGTRPSDYKNKTDRGLPSPRALEEWVKLRGITSSKYKKPKDLAFAISRSIAREKGTILRFRGGTGLLDYVFKQYEKPLTEEMIEVIGEEITIATEKVFNNANNKN